MGGLIFVGFIFYSVGALVTIINSDNKADGHEVLFWPIIFIKWLLKGLYKVLFTGWRD